MAVQTVTVIKQADLQRIHDLQGEIADKQATFDRLVADVKQQLHARAAIEPGRFDAKLVFKRSHNVAWKQVVIERLGPAYADEVWRGTPTITRCELVVIEHAIPPLWKHLESESESIGG